MIEASEIEALVREHWFAADSIAPYGSGHINTTYLVRASGESFVLQKINRTVFVKPREVMANFATIAPLVHGQLALPSWVPTQDGEDYAEVDGEVWRLAHFIGGTRVLDEVGNAEEAAALGAVFGRFQAATRSLRSADLFVPIANFLRLGFYLAEYDEARMPLCNEFAQLIDGQRPLADEFAEPNACIHGDCKIDNVLFAADGNEVAAVIDLDTVMWGHWAWDWGDLVRSACVRDEQFELGWFAPMARAFAAQQPLATVEGLARAPRYVCAMLAIRFLTDHCRGDVYFNVNRRGENLDRARAQFALLSSMIACESDMRRVAEAAITG